MKCTCCGGHLTVYKENETWRFYRCNTCHFWTSRAIDGSYPSMTYNNTPTFDENSNDNSNSFVEYSKKIMEHKFAKVKMNQKQGNFLDIGCSLGSYVEASELLGWKSIGFEIDKEKLKICQERSINVRFPDYSSLDSNSIDFILARHVIEHIPDFMDTLRSAVNLLKVKGGVLCIETPNQNGIITRFTRNKIVEERFLGHLYPSTHIHAFEPITYEFIAKSLGMRVIKKTTYSPNDELWTFSDLYQRKGVIPFIHNVGSFLGKGENIAVFMIKE